MKKLAIVLTLISSVAFAQKHMVRFDANGGAVSTVDFSSSKSDDGTNTDESKNMALNYAYTVAPQWQVGLTYESASTTNEISTANESSEKTTGLDVYWNKDADLANTCYFGLHYHMTKYTVDAGTGQGFVDGDEDTSITLEYGHRFSMGKLWGNTVTYAPNFQYAMTTRASGLAVAADDVKSKAFGFNFLKFDVLF